jgi:hypothetical protein
MIAPLFWSEASNLPWAGILANHLWQSTVIAVMVWLLALTLRKNCAHTRYRLWMAASVKFLVPFSLFIQAGEWLRPIVAAPAQTPAAASAMEQIARPFHRAMHLLPWEPERFQLLTAWHFRCLRRCGPVVLSSSHFPGGESGVGCVWLYEPQSHWRLG